MLSDIRALWNKFQGMDQLHGALAAFVPSVFGIICFTITTVKHGESWHYTVTELPAPLRPVAYLAATVVFWSFYQFFERLLPHALHLKAGFWTKAGWIALILVLYPFGPPLYYFAIYRRSPITRGDA